MSEKRSYWYQLVNGKPAGPLTVIEVIKKIRSSELTSHDLFYKAGDSKWRPLAEFSEFKSLFKKRSQSSKDLWVLLKKSQDESKKFEQHGPLSTKQIVERIEAGEITEADYLWQQGMREWSRISELNEFADLFKAEIVSDEKSEPVFYDEKTIVSVPASVKSTKKIVSKKPEKPEKSKKPVEEKMPDEADGVDQAGGSLNLEDLKKSKSLFKGDIRLPKEKRETPKPNKPSPATATHVKTKSKDIKIESAYSRWFNFSELMLNHKPKVVMLSTLVISLLVFYSLFKVLPMIDFGTDVVSIKVPKGKSKTKASKRNKVKVSKPQSVKSKTADIDVKPPSFLKVKISKNKSGVPVLTLITDASPHFDALFYLLSPAGKVIGVKSVHWYKKVRIKDKRTMISLAEWSLPEGIYQVEVSFDKLEKKFKVNNFPNSKKFYSKRNKFIKAQSYWIHKEKKRLFKFTNKMSQLLNQINANLSMKQSNKSMWRKRYREYRSKLKSYSALEIRRLTSTKRSKVYFPDLWRQYSQTLSSTGSFLKGFNSGSKLKSGISPIKKAHAKLLYKARGLSVY